MSAEARSCGTTSTIGRRCRDNLLNHVTANGVQLCQDHCHLAAVMEDGKPREAEVYLHHADGYRVPVMVRATALRDGEGRIIGAVESFSNNETVINARRRLQDMRQIAHTDPLTRIGNRTYMERRIRAAMVEFEDSQSRAGLLFMDIDHFKNINDTHGHHAGDLALQMVANTFRLALRSTDTIGRWGGEEFVAILHDISGEDALQAAAEKVRSLVETSRLAGMAEVATGVLHNVGNVLNSVSVSASLVSDSVKAIKELVAVGLRTRTVFQPAGH